MIECSQFQKEYSRTIISLNNKLQVLEEEIYNMDETPILFDTVGKYTYDFAGVNSVSVETTGNTKSRITLILCINWAGEKIIPFIIFKSKSKKQPIIVAFKDKNKNILAYHCGQPHATNDGKTMVVWIKNVFSKRDNTTRRCILTMDNVKFHHSVEVKAALKEQNVRVSYFPANTTSACSH